MQAGLATALMLEKRGWKNVTVVERMPTPTHHDKERAFMYLIDARYVLATLLSMVVLIPVHVYVLISHARLMPQGTEVSGVCGSEGGPSSTRTTYGGFPHLFRHAQRYPSSTDQITSI
eukprot:7047411-Pyramimonas_sp.AAC.1